MLAIALALGGLFTFGAGKEEVHEETEEDYEGDKKEEVVEDMPFLRVIIVVVFVGRGTGKRGSLRGTGGKGKITAEGVDDNRTCGLGSGT